jgi:hypothetical protein
MRDPTRYKHAQASIQWSAESPLEASADAYDQYLAVRGYAAGTIEGCFGSVAHFAHWLAPQCTGIDGTTSVSFPTLNAYPSSLQGASDIFVAKIDSGGGVVYSTYLGGTESNAEMGVAIAVDSVGRAYVTGRTNALDFPLKNGPGPAPSGQNQAFLAVIDPRCHWPFPQRRLASVSHYHSVILHRRSQSIHPLFFYHYYYC